jgi:type II secretory pathway component PulM
MADANRSTEATLGCGTLILIAIIVMIFSKPGVNELEKEVRALRGEVKELKQAVQDQTQHVKGLLDGMEKPKAPSGRTVN